MWNCQILQLKKNFLQKTIVIILEIFDFSIKMDKSQLIYFIYLFFFYNRARD